MLVEQRSPEWFTMRKGKITSSEVYKIMGESRSKTELLSETAKSYLLEKVAESLGGESNSISNQATEWGTDLEDTAVEVYEARTSQKVDKCSFITLNDSYGGSPDGLVGQEGCIEIKCPFSSANHIKYSLISNDAEFKKVVTNYYYQCMSHMLVSGAKWCDFISFDPRVDAEYMMFVYRLHRNEEEIENMKAKIEIAVNYINEVKSKLPKYYLEPSGEETP